MAVTDRDKSLRFKLESEVNVDLKPGELFIADKPILIKTLLGSCVSVVLHNKRTKISTVSHAQLPSDKATEKCADNCPVKCNRETPESNLFRYVTYSTQHMFDKLAYLGIRNNEIDVKLFGGANVIKAISRLRTIGDLNVEKAHDMVNSYDSKVIGEDTGGERGRTIYLYTNTGEVYVRKHVKIDSLKILTVNQ